MMRDCTLTSMGTRGAPPNNGLIAAERGGEQRRAAQALRHGAQVVGAAVQQRGRHRRACARSTSLYQACTCMMFPQCEQRSLQAWLSAPGLQRICMHMSCADCNLQAALLACMAAGMGSLRARSPVPSSASSLAACIAPMEKPACAPRDADDMSDVLFKPRVRRAAHMPSQESVENKLFCSDMIMNLHLVVSSTGVHATV